MTDLNETREEDVMSIFETASAFAQEAQPRNLAPSGVAALVQSPLTMLVIIFAIFYFLIIRPQQKKQRELQDMLKNLNKGDKVITTGGIYGSIISLSDNIVTLQVDDRVKIRVSRSAIAGLTKE